MAVPFRELLRRRSIVPGSKRQYRRRPYGCDCDYCERGRAIEREPNRTTRERRALAYQETAT